MGEHSHEQPDTVNWNLLKREVGELLKWKDRTEELLRGEGTDGGLIDTVNSTRKTVGEIREKIDKLNWLVITSIAAIAFAIVERLLFK